MRFRFGIRFTRLVAAACFRPAGCPLSRAGLLLGLAMLAAAPASAPTSAQVFPTPRQAAGALDGIDGSGMARLGAGRSGFVDPMVSNNCRFVANANPQEIVIPLSTSAEWLYFRAGQSSGRSPPGVTETVCCRPQSPRAADFCPYGGTPTGIAPATLDYTVLAGSISASATCARTCTDTNGTAFDCSYADTVAYQCGQTGTGAAADGQWTATGQSAACTPNAHASTGACSTQGVGGWGVQTVTIYNSCGQVQSAYSQSCYTTPPCTPNYQQVCTGCSGGSQTCYYHDANSCGGGDYGYSSQSCGPVMVGRAWCNEFPPGTYNYNGCTNPVHYTCGGPPCELYWGGGGDTWNFWGVASYAQCPAGTYQSNFRYGVEGAVVGWDCLQ